MWNPAAMAGPHQFRGHPYTPCVFQVGSLPSLADPRLIGFDAALPVATDLLLKLPLGDLIFRGSGIWSLRRSGQVEVHLADGLVVLLQLSVDQRRVVVHLGHVRRDAQRLVELC